MMACGPCQRPLGDTAPTPASTLARYALGFVAAAVAIGGVLYLAGRDHGDPYKALPNAGINTRQLMRSRAKQDRMRRHETAKRGRWPSTRRASRDE